MNECVKLFVNLSLLVLNMPKKGASKAKKKDDWPDDEDTGQQLTEKMKKLTSDESSGASSVRRLFNRLACRKPYHVAVAINLIPILAFY